MRFISVAGNYLWKLLLGSLLTAFFLIGLFVFLKPNIDGMFALYYAMNGSTNPFVPISYTTSPLSPDSVEIVASRAINATKDAIDIFKWAILSIIAIFGGIIGYFVKTLKDSDDKLKETGNKVLEVQIEFEKASRKLDDAQKTLSSLSFNYFELQQQLFDLPSTLLPYDIALEAYESGKISKESLIESQQWFSWLKMVYSVKEIRETGYQELKVHFKESGIPLKIKRAMLTELHRIEMCEKRRGFILEDEKLMRYRIAKFLGINDASTLRRKPSISGDMLQQR